jgi:RNA polymerase sigma factor (sigma-70 family)
MASALPAADEFVAAFARHGRALWVLAAAWVGRADAQDLVQETARIAWQRRAQFAPGTGWAAWLAQIARHTGANWRRKRRPAACDPSELPEPTARDDHTPRLLHAALDCEQLPDELARALQTLPETARACLLLHVVAGLTFPEIAAMLDLPENTAMSHARRARVALREALAPSHTDVHEPTPLPEAP